MSDGSVETTCGKTFDSQPAAAGHTSSCGCEIVTDGGADTDAAEPAGDALREELNTILSGKDPLSNISVKRTGLNRYAVLSARNGSVTQHEVNLKEPSCTCPDFDYNRDQEKREVCAHYVAAHLHASDVAAGTIAMSDVAQLMVESRKLKEEAEAALEGAEEANVAAREAQAGAVQDANSGPSDSELEDSEPDGQAAAEAADRLQDAFDDVLDDMQVQHHAGHVWFQTGQDTPDDWPYPGGDETFQVVTGPDAVKYVHDGSADWADSPHPLYDDKPGEWWKNALEPGDVDEYIEEVLE